MNNQTQYTAVKRLLLSFCLFICTLVICNPANAQFKPLTPGKGVSLEKPPRPIYIKVSTAQHLNFGTIIPVTTGGELIVDYKGIPSILSGDLLLIHTYDCKPALFIVDAEPGVLINIFYPNPISALANGGHSMKLTLGLPYIDDQPGYQFITNKQFTNVYIGGTLKVGSISDNPSGSYSGTFQVTFIQQ